MAFLMRRLVRVITVVLFVTFFSYFLLNLLPGDPVDTIAPFATKEIKEAIRKENHLDRAVPVQYWFWVEKFVQGDLGYNYTPSSKNPVADDVKSHFPVSVQLVLYSILLTMLCAIPLGVFTAYAAGSRLDRGINTVLFGAFSIPDFAIGLLLAYFVGVKLGWLPNGGYKPFGSGLWTHARTMILPVISLAIAQIAGFTRVLRSDMIATLQEDFITMAKSKGISGKRVLWRHALRPSSLTLLTVAGLNVGALIGGTVVIEAIFNLPGMGLILTSAIRGRQFIALQSTVAIIAIGYVLINVMIDLLYTVLDPRVRNVS